MTQDPWKPVSAVQDWNPSQAEIDAAHAMADDFDKLTARISVTTDRSAGIRAARVYLARYEIRKFNRLVAVVDFTLAALAIAAVAAVCAYVAATIGIDMRGAL